MKSDLVLKAQRRGAAIVASALGVAVAIAACGSSVPVPAQSQLHNGVQHASITVDGQKRTYSLFLPAGLDATKRAPLVVALTGCPSAGDDMANATHLDDLATSKGFVIVYPDPVNGCWNTGTCCGSAHDTKFIGQLVDKLTAEIRVDHARIFAVGFSAGAIFTYTLACAFSDRFAAIVSDAGREDGQTCQPARPVSVFEIHGTEDTSVLYDAGSQAVQRWVGLDGCPAPPAMTVNGITKTSLWNGCRANTVVRFDTVVGGYHQWFGSPFAPIPGEPDSNALMWAFFSGLQPRS